MTSASPSLLQRFLSQESASGILLVLAAVLAMVLANSPLAQAYHLALHHAVWTDGPDMAGIVKDGLMTLFFLLVGLEIKREVMDGELSTRHRALLPVCAAIGGMVVPAGIYLALNAHDPALRQGWAIPSATDIAFAAGVLGLMRRYIPAGLRIFLLALAIIDDLGAVLIIAMFYSGDLHGGALILSLVVAGALYALNRVNILSLWPYMIGLCVLWLCLHESGLHATLAGVVTASFIPLGAHRHGRAQSPLLRLEHILHPWVAFGIMPLFALANAGLTLGNVTQDMFLHSVTLGVGLGLFLGKPLGVFLGAWAAIRAGWAHLPHSCHHIHILAVGMIAGIGFTMSLFIGQIAFTDAALYDTVRLGVLLGSFASAMAGLGILFIQSRGKTGPA